MRKIPDRYWVGGTATWDATAGTKWSATSGGAGGASVPTTADDVYFDAASGAAVVSAAPNAQSCRNLNCTGFTGSLQIAGTMTVAGGLTFSAGMTLTGSGWTVGFSATTDNGGVGWPVTTNGKTFNNVTFNGVGGKWTLQDALTTSGVFAHTNGHLDTNSQAVTINNYLNYGGGGAKTLTLGSSAVYVLGNTYLINATGGGLTVTPNTATFTMGPNATIVRGNQDWGGASLDVTRNTDGTGQRGLELAGTWKDITVTTGVDTLNSLSSSFVATGTLTLTGRNSTTSRMLVSSATLGTPLVITAGATSLTDVDFMDIAIVGPTGSTITSDSFDRADGALGTTDAADGGSALAWTASSGTWVIDTNKAACTTAAAGYRDVTVDVGVTDMAVEAVITPGVEFWGLTARFTDQNNRIWVQQGGASLPVVVQIAAGSQNIIFTASAAISAGDRCRLVVAGNNVVLYKNDTSIGAGVITKTLTGTRAGLTAYAYNADPARRFDDFKVLNVPNVTGTRLGDCLGNSGIEFTTAPGTPRDGGGAGVKRYAVAPGNFSSTTMWSETSGGTPGASVPLPQDDVYLDANSAAGTYVIDTVRTCRNLDGAGFTRTLDWANGSSPSIYGSLNLPSSGFTWDGTNTATVTLRGRSSHAISTPQWPSFANGTLIVAAPSGTYTMNSDLLYTAHFQINSGTFDLNGYDMTALTVTDTGGTSATRSLILGSGTITIGAGSNAGTQWSMHPNITLSAANSTIVFAFPDSASRNPIFDGGGKVYGTVTHTVANQSGGFTIAGSNTFNTVNIGASRSLKLTSGTTQKIGTLNINGVNLGGAKFTGTGGGSSGSVIYYPDSTALSVTGDLDVRCKISLPDWTPGAQAPIIAKENGAGQRSFIFSVYSGGGNSGRLEFMGSSDGTNWVTTQSSAVNSITDGSTAWIRFTYQQSNRDVKFYTGSDGVNWTQLGTTQTAAGPTAIFDSTAPLWVGSCVYASWASVATVYRTQIRNNILDNGTGIVFDVDYGAIEPYWYDSINGAAGQPGTLSKAADGRVVIESTTAGSAATLQVDSTTGMNYVDLRDVVMNGADTYIGATSVIRSNVKGVRRGPKTGLGV